MWFKKIGFNFQMTEVNTFQIITDFVNELHNLFGTKQKSLALFHRLVKTSANNPERIETITSKVKGFCTQNRMAIQENNASKLLHTKLVFSDRIFIDIGLILTKSPPDVVRTVWKYLLTFSALLDAESNAKDVLRNQVTEQHPEPSLPTEINEIFGDLVESIKTDIKDANIQPSDNPMEMVSSLLKSGALTKIMDNFQTKMESGELNLQKLMGVAQHMMGDMMNQAGGDPMMQAMMMNMMSQMPDLEKTD
jgi:hypothetical protein